MFGIFSLIWPIHWYTYRKKQKHIKRTDTKELRCGKTPSISVLRSSVEVG